MLMSARLLFARLRKADCTYRPAPHYCTRTVLEHCWGKEVGQTLAQLDAESGIWKKYKVWDDSTIRSGTAREILQEIVSKPSINLEIRGMTVGQYAAALIKDAPYYLPKKYLAGNGFTGL